MKLRRVAFAFLLAGAMVFSVFAHPGGTDGSGGHTNHSTGEYHYHHGYSAHQHVNGECPYASDDKTGQNSGESPSTRSTVKAERKSSEKDAYESGLNKVVFTIGKVFAALLGVGLAHSAVLFIGSFIFDRRQK